MRMVTGEYVHAFNRLWVLASLVATTTIGLSIKTLQNSTAYVTGSAVIFLVPPTTSAGARSLFGSTVLQSSKGMCTDLLVHKPCKC